MSNRITQKQAEQIRELIIACGKVMLTAHDVEAVDGGITVKPGDSNFVTMFDVSVQNRLMEGLLGIFPDAVFFAEEKDNVGVDFTGRICFIIDPIDGTNNFIHDLAMSAVSVGALYDGEPFFGAIYDPYRDEYFEAQTGCGAFCNGRPVRVSHRELSKALIAFGASPYKKTEFAADSFRAAEEIFRNCVDLRRSGSAAIDMVNVACGRLDGFFEFTLCPWDYAAGYVIVREAGGEVSSFDGTRVSFEKSSSLLCTNGMTYNKLREILNK